MDEEDLSLSDDFDRAVEEDRAEVLAREQSSSVSEASPVEAPGAEAPGAEVPDAEVPDTGWGALEEDPADGATSEDNDPLFALEAGADEGAAPCHAEPTPLPRSSVPDREARPAVPRQADGAQSTTSPPARVPRPPRLGRAATAVGWTLTLGLCALGLLWEIRATLGG